MLLQNNIILSQTIVDLKFFFWPTTKCGQHFFLIYIFWDNFFVPSSFGDRKFVVADSNKQWWERSPHQGKARPMFGREATKPPPEELELGCILPWNFSFSYSSNTR